jgi:hypothetical protein
MRGQRTSDVTILYLRNEPLTIIYISAGRLEYAYSSTMKQNRKKERGREREVDYEWCLP